MLISDGCRGTYQLKFLLRRRHIRSVRSNLKGQHKRYHPSLLLRLTFNRSKLFQPKFIKSRSFLLTESKNLYRNGLQKALKEGKGLEAMYRGRCPY